MSLIEIELHLRLLRRARAAATLDHLTVAHPADAKALALTLRREMED